MDSAYDRKFEEMKKYIPFLERMIQKLESTSTLSSSNPRQAQLEKIRSLRDLLLDKRKRMKMDNLLKCEQVLVNLYAKVEQRDTLPGIKNASDPLFPSNASTEAQNVDLDTARNKLKRVVVANKGKLPENDPDTLPEIALACETEVVCTPGSKEPALFQRRPNKNSRSPVRKSPAKESNEKKSPQKTVPKRNYTRVLVSPEPSSRRWTPIKDSPSDEPLFSRRSPRKSPKHVSPHKRDKKKSSKSGKTKPTDLNITLKVPKDSLDSLNTGDILSRIIKCPDNDVDIDTLRDLRTQILGELKLSGANDDISDLILKSYKKKKRFNTRKTEIEEGELSDSESEAIQSVYSSLVVVDKDKNKTITKASGSADKEKQARKIQINLVINKEATDKKKEGTEVVDFEMFDLENTNEVINTANDPNQKVKKVIAQSLDKQLSKEMNISTLKHNSEDLLTIDVEDDDDLNNTKDESKDSDSSYIDISSSDTEIQPSENKNTNTESDVTFKANFYNEHKETEKENPSMTSVDIDSTNKDVPESLTQEKSKTSDDIPVLSETSAPTDTSPTKSDETVNTSETCVSSKEVHNESEIPKQTEEIPLLNTEPIIQASAKKDTVSEIDILQALKNDILSESIAIPGSDAATPLLHQPKITKVASAQEITSKKRISIEKYKQKSVKATKTKPLFLNDPNISLHSDTAKKTSLKLTEQEQQRFNFLPLPLDSSDEDEKESHCSVDDIYADLAPKSPENSDETTSSSTPIIIPADPVKPTIAATSTDVDMRTMIQKLSPNISRALPPPTGIFPQTTSRRTSIGEKRNENQIEPRRAPLDPRVRRDLKQPIGKDSPNANVTTRHTGISTPRRNHNMTPNSRSFEMTPSRQTFDLDNSSNRKHVYAPFPTFDSRDQRDQLREDPGPRWEPNDISERRQTRWDTSKDSDLRETRWEERDQRGRSSRDSGSDYRKSTHDTDKYHENREDYLYSRMDCPRTPVHSFGRSDCPTTPTASFGRSECPNTPIHSFGKSDCPTTPIHQFGSHYLGRSDAPMTSSHAFGRSDSPMTPSHAFGRSDAPMTPSYSFGRSDAPITPSHSFGRLDAPMTPSHSFGRSDTPMTPSHSFGRSDAPMTPSHSFGQSDAPMTPSHAFGRSDAPMTPSHAFKRSNAPLTPSHAFGRSDAPITPIHNFGRSDAPMTPSHYFGKSELGVGPMTPSHAFGRSDYQQTTVPKVIKDPRLNRHENESKSRKFEEDRDRGHYKDSQKTNLSTKTYNNSESYRQYREQSVGRYDRNKFYRERTPRRETSVGRSFTREYENECLYTRDRNSGRSNEYSSENEKRTRNYDDQPRCDFQRGRSVGRSETVDNRFQRSGSRGLSDNRNLSKPINANTLSVKPQTGMAFTIDTSVNSTFQEFLNGKGLQVFDYSFDSRRQRAASVGRTLTKESCVGRNFRESSIGSTLSKPAHTTNEQDTSAYKKMVNFVRARSMGRELIDKTEKSFTEIKADLKSFKPNYTPIKENKNIELVNKSNYRDPRSRKDQYERQVERKNTSQNKKPVYSPRKNSRDPRMQRDPNYVHKSKNRYEYQKKNYGIVYSSDNIAKGTILDSGFGVRNYKIPKIKKPIEEKEPVKENTVDLKNSNKKDDKKEKIREEPKLSEASKQKATGGKVVKESHSKGKTDLKKGKDHEKKILAKTCEIFNEIATKPQREKNKRMARRPKVMESEEENIPKVRKPKKAVIDSDSEPDNIEQKTKKIEVSEMISTPIEMEAKDKTLPNTKDDLLSIDDLDMFSGNLTANPVLDNINALIADLDNDIDTTKDDVFPKDLSFDNMFDSIDSPGGNMNESLKDISQVIKNIDQITQENGSNKNLPPEINVVENSSKQVSNKQSILAQDSNKSDSFENTDAVDKPTSLKVESPQKLSEKIGNAASEANIQDNTVHNSTENDVNINHQELSNVNNESVVSTTENNQVSLKKPDELNEDRSSTPDSTMDTSPSVLNNTVEDEGLPDSTNEKKEMDPDVSSTRDQSKISTKNIDVSSEKDNSVNSIGNLLSMLQDKNKIKELLSMLGEAQSGDNEKIKKKLEKLSEIVSDDEDTNDGGNDDKTEKCQQDASKDIIDSQHEESKETEINMDDTKIEAEVSHDNSDAIIMKSDADKLLEPENNLNIFSKLQDTEQIEAKKPTTKDKKPKKTLNRGRKANSKNNKNSLPGKRVTRSGTANKPVKPKKPSRELRQLQESIKEMFIKDDILNATGIRMCRLSKLVDVKSTNPEDVSDPQSVSPKPVVVLEKLKDIIIEEKSEPKLEKKPKAKSKTKSILSDTDESVTVSKLKDTKTFTALKYKPGQKSKTKNPREYSDPYLFDDSISEATTAQTSEHENESETEDDSLASLKSSESSEALVELKKKLKRKRTRAWQSGIIKKRKRRKNGPKQDEQLPDESSVIPGKDIKIPDMNCFTDKSYCFLKNVTEYPCRLCTFSGNEIVKHYKTDHPHTEIPLSRMNVAVAREAVEQCEDINFQAISKMPTEKYVCRFCFEEFTKKNNVLEEFFWHVVSMHTGEYKRLCSECVNVTRCPFNLDIPPPPKDLKGQLIGYICGKCNFTQISLENLKTHVIVRHNDEQTAVYTINLAVMSNKTIQALMKRCNAQDQARVRRSLRSKTSATDKSEHEHNGESDPDAMSDVENATKLKSIKTDKSSKSHVQSKLSFENDDNMSEAAKNEVKVKTEDVENNKFESTDLHEPITHSDTEQEQASSDILDCPHFKIIYVSNGSKEYVCCINGVDNHYKTHLLISLKKHVQLKHLEIWDGYCFICKVIVMPQGGHRFKECLQHMLDKHMDNFPVIQQAESETTSQTETALGNKRPLSEILDPTPERTSSPQTYINLRPLTDLLEPVNKETDEVLPKIQSVVSLGSTETHEDSTSTSTDIEPAFKCPTAVEKVAPKSEEPYKYEEMQAEVMSKKHLAILETMLSEEKLVQIFKCAGRFCSFTTDSADAALLHASTHQRIGGENSLLCAYCEYDCNGDAIDLVMHVFKMHGSCRFVCGLCFYRAVASQLVLAHVKRVHGGTHAIVLETATVSPIADDVVDVLPREVAVQYYLCPEYTKTCKFKTYTQGKFIEHLTKHAAPYICHQCSQESRHPTELLDHLKTHGLKLYQCTWCVEGGDNEGDFLAHSSSRHPTRMPQAYLRIITNSKGGGSKAMVLPLAKLNKSAVQTRLVTPQNTSISSAREAEKALEMEKLIAATPTVTDDKKTKRRPKTYSRLVMNIPSKQSTPQIVNKKEKPSLQIVNENRQPSPQVTDEEAQPSTQIDNEEGQSSLQITSENGQPSPQIVNEKGPPPSRIAYEKEQPSLRIAKEKETAVSNMDALEQPCLVTPPPATSTQDLPLTPVLKTETVDESTAKDLSNSTIICLDSDEEDTEEHPDRSQQPEPFKENAIDLSDDERSSSAADKYKKLDPLDLYQCTCQVLFKSFAGFKRHILSCYCGKSKYDCAHCTFNTSNLEDYFNHYKIDHSTTQNAQKAVYFCGVCNRMDKSLHVLKAHMKKEHKFMFFTVSSKSNGNYVVSGTVTRNRPGPKRKLSGDPVTESSPKRIRYGAQDLTKLPQKPILDELAYCSECEFSTKVRLNLVRHIQQHADNQLVPQTAPVNPVPHLETNEKHFDKMINLASSSSKIARVAEKSAPSVTLHIPPEAATRYPKYVPDRQRHTCGAKGCSYISVDEAMLKCHWETLHAGSNDFHCVHCPPYQYLDTSKPLTAARIIAHLKMHDIRLYACSACTYYHYLKKVIEKHLSEIHKGSGHILVVREESSGASSPVGISQVSNTAPTMDLKPWKCGLCAFKSMLRPEVIEHCSKTHSSKMQFKCPVCPFRTSTIENVTKHKTKSHPENNEDVFYFYYREGSIPDEKDGTPRWMKQRQKMGNPDPEVKSEELESTEQSVLASRLQPVLPATTSINLNIVKEEVVDPVIEESMEALCKKYGEICDPNGLKFKCPLCKLVTEDNIEAMQSHLYEELKYRKWACSICCYKAFHRKGLHDHMVTEHRQSRTIEPIELDADTRIERWVTKVLDHQAAIIETKKSNLARQKVQVEKPSTSSPPAKTVEKTSEPAPRPSGEKDTELLVQAFGQLGAPNNAAFVCPKCGFQSGDERVMKDHLEIELNKIRWRCSGCWENSQNYHEAQLHSKTCKSSRPGQAVRPVEAIRDPAVRAAWLAAVVRTQKQNMKQAPTPELESPMDDIITGPLENSLLIIRYEERVPTPEVEMLSRRKRPAPGSTAASPDSDDDDERLVIDELSADDSDAPKKHEGNTKKCPLYCMYCPFVTNYKQQLEHHILRHYNLKPMQCCHCEYTCYYSSMESHNAKTHPHLPKKFKKTQVPPGPPTFLETAYKGRKRRSSSSDEQLKRDPKTPTKEVPKKDEGIKLICLVCERAIPESETALHTHDKPTYFAKKGEVVVKCCVCLSLFPKINLMREHNQQCHPNTAINYAYFKINHNNREIHQCGHCTKRFKFFRDLKTHHNVVHSAMQLKYETRPYYPGAYDFECETETKGESSKTSENTSPQDRPVRAAKRVARKSTTKLPNNTVARKSTTKLPFYVYSEETDSESEYSYYGNKPTPLYRPEKYTEILKINPVVFVKDCKK